MTTSIARNVRKDLDRINQGEVFDYSRFKVTQSDELALSKELSRLTQKGLITRIAKGRYIKPKQSRFGVLRPEEDQIIRSLTYRNNQPVGYVTGITLYNRLGLTTQVSNVLVIARNNSQSATEINGYKVRFVKRDVPTSEKDIKLLQLLDVFKDIKDIPDTSLEKALPVLVEAMRSFKEEELKKMVRLALNYGPSTRALLGAVLEQYFSFLDLESLKKSLNVFSRYKLDLGKKLLPTQKNWNIE